MANWKFEKAENIGKYYVTKDGKHICFIRIHKVNIINKTFYTIIKAGESEDLYFDYLKDAKAYIKENY